MGLRIVDGGMLTTVQDLGRVGFQRSGISVSGALDRKALVTANYLVNNPAGEAGIEMTLAGATFEFTAAAVVAATGADLGAALNGVPFPRYRAVAVKAGDLLAFGFASAGCRAYLAVSGGFDLPAVMGSKSTNLKCRIGGLEGRALRTGDAIAFASPPGTRRPRLAERAVETPPLPAAPVLLRAVPGPQADLFSDGGMEAFFAAPYVLSPRSDRMGCVLEGAPVPCGAGTDIISDGIPLGAVQIPSDGKPIVMLADRQTCGGYAKIATVISVDVDLLAQCRPGDAVRFIRVSAEEGRRAFIREKKHMERLRRRLVD